MWGFFALLSFFLIKVNGVKVISDNGLIYQFRAKNSEIFCSVFSLNDQNELNPINAIIPALEIVSSSNQIISFDASIHLNTLYLVYSYMSLFDGIYGINLEVFTYVKYIFV